MASMSGVRCKVPNCTKQPKASYGKTGNGTVQNWVFLNPAMDYGDPLCGDHAMQRFGCCYGEA